MLLKPFKSRQQLTVKEDLQEAARLFEKALNTIGTVKSRQSPENGSILLKGKSHYGMQTVVLEIKLETNETGGTRVNITGHCDDVRAIGAKKCIERLMEVYEIFSAGGSIAPGDASMKDNFFLLRGMSKGQMVRLLIVFMVGIGLLVYLMRGNY